MSEKSNLIVLIVLLILTAISAAVANSGIANAARYIILLAGLKFLLVGFYFMELKEANIAWRILFSAFIGLFCVLFIAVY